MTSIVINFFPFMAKSKMYVYRDGDIIEETDVDVSDLNNIVGAAQTKYGANEINLIGNQDYLSRFKAEMSTKFNNTATINIISR